MSLYSVSDLELIGVAFKNDTKTTHNNAPAALGDFLREIHGLNFDFVNGMASGASVAVSGLSVGGGDTLNAVIVHATVGSSYPRKITAASLSLVGANRVKITQTSTTNQRLQVIWWNKDNA